MARLCELIGALVLIGIFAIGIYQILNPKKK
jgi:hypothetical protein